MWAWVPDMPVVTTTPLILRLVGSTVTEPTPLELKLVKAGFSWARLSRVETVIGAWAWIAVTWLEPLPQPATSGRNRLQAKKSRPVRLLETPVLVAAPLAGAEAPIPARGIARSMRVSLVM